MPRAVESNLIRLLPVALAMVVLAALIGHVDAARAGSCENASARPGKISQKQARHAVVCLINSRRDSHGKRSVATDRGLHKSASRHTRRMVRSDCFSHQCPGEKALGARVQSTSYLPCGCSWGVAETIGWGKGKRGSPKRLVRSWMRSSAHRKVLLDGDFEYVGVAARWGSPNGRGKAGTYTADFGYKRG